MVVRLGLLLALHAFSIQAADWPRLLGPTDNVTTPEAHLLHELPPAGPPILWQMEKGHGYGSPAIVGGQLILFHRIDGREVIESLNATTGERQWKYDYDAPYRPKFGGSEGPQTGPIVADGRVFTFGISGWLHCVELSTGKLLWEHNCALDFNLGPVFFGYGSTPLVMGKRVILQVGGKVNDEPANTIALDVETGKLIWAARHPWGPSYASPIPAKLYERECVLVFAGGESQPPTGGLLTIDAADGRILSAIPHRASMAESVNASSPVMVSTDPPRVFISEAYTAGALCVEFAPNFAAKAVWRAKTLGLYWMTPLVREGYLYSFAGQQERTAELVCTDLATGQEKWRNDLGGKFGRGSLLGTADGALCLGEFGDLAWLELGPTEPKILSAAKLFNAPETWTLPALSNGLLYVSQNQPGSGKTKPRIICYDLRAVPQK